VGEDVVRRVRYQARAERVIRVADLDELDFVHAGVRVAPLALGEIDAGVGLEVDDGVGASRQELRRPRDARRGVGAVWVSIDHASTLTDSLAAPNAAAPNTASSWSSSAEEAPLTPTAPTT